MAHWSTPEPRIVMCGQIRREVWEALDVFIEDAQQDGMPQIQRYYGRAPEYAHWILVGFSSH